MREFFAALRQVEGAPFVLVTLTSIRGEAPQEVGAKMIVTPKGLAWGTVGGGKIENHCIKHGVELLRSRGSSVSETWNLQTDIGMSCGGEVSLFFDVSRPSHWPIAVFGAGHVSQALCRVLAESSADITVFDTRSEWVDRLPEHVRGVTSPSLAREVEELRPGTVVISMTQGHAHDVPVLDQALRRSDDFPFVGVIGSAVKAGRIRRELGELGHGPELISRVQCPVGLPLGNNTPVEIAISIASQLLAIRDATSFSVKQGSVALH